MDDSKKKKEGYLHIINMKWWEWGIFILLFAMALFAPLIFSQFSIISFKETGQIGDTIGGSSAPFVGLLGAFLVYKSFEAQMLANRELYRQHKVQMTYVRFEQSMNMLLHMFGVVQESVNDRNNLVNGGWRKYMNYKTNQCRKDISHVAQGSEAYNRLKSRFEEDAKKGIRNLNLMLTDLEKLLNTIWFFIDTYSSIENVPQLYTFYLDKAEELVKSINKGQGIDDRARQMLREDDFRTIGVGIEGVENRMTVMLNRLIELKGSDEMRRVNEAEEFVAE
ncbi:hypothetical protein SAMN04490243_1190 [Robiginitalea myxolifaciens]|uniref:Uncharacterized protein n=1 Tax=Robiginitalea myxolifaciens TaxID=400055 RepID=A0A1I6G3Q4_9FLAO|nr:hypothetical protein [Robiginitalea myxolifaciens]SFR36826.1 hypothetical protein SAMN04490243_1190 [Robiginitalea myxolifaciens]